MRLKFKWLIVVISLYPVLAGGSEVEGKLQIKGNHAQLIMGDDEEYSCRAGFTLVGDYLVVSDNHNCGGLNVTFDNVYRKKPNR